MAWPFNVATAMKDGVKDILFYTRNAQEFLKRAEKYRYLHHQFEVECEVSPDPDWKHLRRLSIAGTTDMVDGPSPESALTISTPGA